MRDAYAYASVNYATLRYVPCYCGCGEQGQRNNGDCFVREAREGSWVELDPHGFACGTCVGVALDAKDLAARGMSVRAIPTAIDAKWAKTGPSTPTAMP